MRKAKREGPACDACSVASAPARPCARALPSTFHTRDILAWSFMDGYLLAAPAAGKHVVFGKVVEGLEVLARIGTCGGLSGLCVGMKVWMRRGRGGIGGGGRGKSTGVQRPCSHCDI